MADQNDVSIKVGASIDALKSSLDQAQNAVKTFSEQIKSHLQALQAPFAGITKAMGTIAAIAAGGAVFRDFVKSSLDATGETVKLSRQMGITLEQASLLRTELKITGNTTEAYAEAAAHLDRQIRTNETSLNKYGLVTRDASGHLLNQMVVTQNAIELIKKYKEGTDRTIASQTLFGRGASDLESLFRLNSAAMQRAAKDLDDFGGRIGPEEQANAARYRQAMGELNFAFERLKDTVGRAVIPVLTKFVEMCRSIAPDAIKIVKGAISDLSNIGQNFGFVWEEFSAALEAVFEKAKVILPVLGSMIKNAFNPFMSSAEWSKIGSDAPGALQAITDKYNAAIADVQRRREAARAAGGEQFGPPMPGKGEEGLSATGMLKDREQKQHEEAAKQREEREKLRADYLMSMEEQNNEKRLALGQITEQQFIQQKINTAYAKAKIDDLALVKERDVFERGSAEWEKAENARVKSSEKASLEIAKLQAKMVEDQKKVFIDLANGINSSIESSTEQLITSIGDKTKKLKDIFTSFLKSLQSDFAKFAAQNIMKGITGGISGAGGGGLGIGGLVSSLFSGFHAEGGFVPAGSWGIAGEAGPEIITGGNSGASVTPIKSGDTNHNYNINVSGATGNSEIRSMVAAGMQVAYNNAMRDAPARMASMQSRAS